MKINLFNTRGSRSRLLSGLVLGLFAMSTWALDTGPTVTGEICMQKVFGSPVANSNRLNCTANDIRLSRVVSVVPDSCTVGSTFDLQATFEIDVTANSRYDAGFFFRIDGGRNARGDGVNASGHCSLSGLKPPPPPNAPSLNLDGDSCGDLNSGKYQVSFTIPDVTCEDSDGDGLLNMPYCTSWHSNASTHCQISDPFSTADAFTFHPETKSKCVCDDNFQVPVRVEAAEIRVTKLAIPSQVPEPGGQVTFSASVENLAEFASVVITTIVDDLYGDLGDPLNPNVSDNTCPSLIGQTLNASSSLDCSFKVMVYGNAGDRITDIIDICALQPTTGATVCGWDDAHVDITDIYTEPTLEKTALSTSNCSMDANYQVVVSNNSEFDVLTVNSLIDDKFGTISSVQGDVISTTCALPADVDPLENYSCTFVGQIFEADCEITHTNTVTAYTIDDDGVESIIEDDATVTLTTNP